MYLITLYSYPVFFLVWPSPITLTYELDLHILKTYLHIRNELSWSRFSKVRARIGQTDRRTDATERITTATLAGCNERTQYHSFKDCNIKTILIHTKLTTTRTIYRPTKDRRTEYHDNVYKLEPYNLTIITVEKLTKVSQCLWYKGNNSGQRTVV